MVLDLMKLEKIEFGGTRGKTLSQQVLHMYEEFLEEYKVFTEKPCDSLSAANLVFAMIHSSVLNFVSLSAMRKTRNCI